MTNRIAHTIIASMFGVALLVLMTSCDTPSPSEVCADKQDKYEKDYQAEFGTTEGMDPNKYTYDPDSRACATNQGVQG